MKTRYRLTVPLFVLGVAMSGFALQSAAEPPRRIERLAHQLDLTEAQQTALADLREEFRGARSGMRESRNEVGELIKSGQSDAAADLAAQAARDRVYRSAERRSRLAEILTPEQLAQMDELQSDRRGRGHRSRRGR